MFKYDERKVIGKTFGGLTVKAKAPSDPKWNNANWVCECVCGNTKIVRSAYLRISKNPSCGCIYYRAVSEANKKYVVLADYLRNTKNVNSCLEWQGHINTSGYGFVGVYTNKFEPRKSGLVHRRVYELLNGELPEVVMHICDNRKCINPDHLRGGTQSENIQDAHDKKRMVQQKNKEHTK